MATTLGKMLTAYEQKFDLSSRKVAAEIGIDRSLLCRIKQGRMPDARNLALIITWMLNEGAA